MDYATIGWTNIFIVAVLVSPFVLTRLNKSLFNHKNKKLQSAIKFLRKLHKPFGFVLLIISAIHGWLALGSLRLHTGTILYATFFISGLLGIGFHKTKNKNLFTWHRRLVWVSVALLAVHLLMPGAVYQLMN